MQRLRLCHADLDSWVDVRLCAWDGRWLAVADFAGEPDIGIGRDARTALRRSLIALGPRLASDVAERAGIDALSGDDS